MYYSMSMRLDVYLNGVYVQPTNAYYIGKNMVFKNVANNSAPFMPTYNSATGTNLFYKNRIWVTMSGADVIDVQIAPVLFISFSVPAMTPDQFFEPSTLVSNFAALLGLNPSQIKTVNIVSASNSTSFNNRRRRDLSSSSNIMINLTIYDNPITFLNNTLAINQSVSDLKLASARIINQFAVGELQQKALALFNVSLKAMSVRPPQAPVNESDVIIGEVNKLQVMQQESGCSAQVPCQVQPIVKVVDGNVSRVSFKIVLIACEFRVLGLTVFLI